MRDIILLIILIIVMFDGCDVKFSIDGEVHSFQIESFIETRENRDETK